MHNNAAYAVMRRRSVCLCMCVYGILCRTAFALNQTLQSFGNILKLTFSVQHLTFYSLILLSVDSVMHLCPFCNRRVINVR